VTEYQVRKGRCFDRDIEKIHAFLLKNEYCQSAIRTIFNRIYEDMALLRNNPRLGAGLNNKTTIPNDYRYLVSGDYLIFYKVFDSEKLVRVYRVHHGKENYLVKLGLNG
jgi:plasmid stabilization system protein ParE